MVKVINQTNFPIRSKKVEKACKKIEQILKLKNSDINIVFIKSTEIKKLNNKYRKKNKITDVLSFTYRNKPLQGEILICYSRAKAQAHERHITIREELNRLVVHGMLHIVGQDHMKKGEAKKMFDLEDKILIKLN